MPYNKFTLRQVVTDFDLKLVEGKTFLPEIEPVKPQPLLEQTLEQNLPWATAVGTEKARSEGIITPVLLEVRRILGGRISVFSGEEFTVDPEQNLNGYCDFLISKSPEQLFIESPVMAIVEAKRDDIKSGLGQCLAQMVAAQWFNQRSEHKEVASTVYGAVTTGTVWRFMKLEDQIASIDLEDYPLPPAEKILGALIWMIKN
ncbi:hypothetical protein H6G00_01935 [Leptolyngbya sp. FACHB-541]|uniref:hypothetical protein n=1 Tax=Leptolyngbya sp. FACHB-541 TaxID=2692810 RepID=UPI0016898825|nr:hypothetical protein [Leptolyngbya sp. FACHB-541]MBD1995392.1 hypothetical protein [Leptolyngbya sp. FACHB-541]